MKDLTCVELCAGAGGQALGLEQAGFQHLALVDIDQHCYETLRLNRPSWNVIQGDINNLSSVKKALHKADLLAAGLPCPPFSVAGKQLGKKDERDLFPAALDIIEEVRPKAIMIENVKGFLSPAFEQYRIHIKHRLQSLGYETEWRLLNASDFGVPQLRPRVVIVALRRDLKSGFSWPAANGQQPPTAGDALADIMSSCGWKGAEAWRLAANTIAPTIVGGLDEARWSRFGPDSRKARMGCARSKRSLDCGRATTPGLRRAAPPDRSDGRPSPRVSRRLGVLRQEDGGISSSR